MPVRQGAILWFTGLSGSGKSSLSQALAPIIAQHHPVEILDGDQMRKALCRDLGFTREDRDENVHRLGFVARLLARHGIVALVAAISPYRSARDEVRARAAAEGIPYIEIHTDATLEALVSRDVKGLYRRAIAGEIPNFTGITDPYERPDTPEIAVRTDQETLSESVARVVVELRARELLGPSTERVSR